MNVYFAANTFCSVSALSGTNSIPAASNTDSGSVAERAGCSPDATFHRFIYTVSSADKALSGFIAAVARASGAAPRTTFVANRPLLCMEQILVQIHAGITAFTAALSGACAIGAAAVAE